MRVRHLAPFLAGLLVAMVVAGFPALAADQAVQAGALSWSPANVSIQPNESVTWSNPGGGMHNVCVRSPGASTGCGEFRNGDPNIDWSGYTNAHTFANAGTYTFLCEYHGSIMSGTVTVGDGGGTTTTDTTTTTTTTTTTSTTGTGTGTGRCTTPPPSSQPTETITTPTQTEQTTVTGDKTAPAFSGKVKRRASRKALVLELGSSETATLRATVFRRAPGRRSFARVSDASLHVKQGKNVVKVPRAALRRGAYRVKLQLVDAAGNRSAAKTLSFKIA
jgi:plastocyanin